MSATTENTSLLSGLEQSTNDSKRNASATSISFSRRLARFLSRYTWYNPHAPDATTPNLDAGWHYYENVSLPRYLKRRDDDDDTTKGGQQRDAYVKAEPGDETHETELYPVWSTPEVQLADFGSGVGLYFWGLRMFAVIMFLAGCLNVPTMSYFASTAYDPGDDNGQEREFIFKTSAICTATTWVACPSCTSSNEGLYSLERTAQSQDGQLQFLLQNDCNVGYHVGLMSCITLVFVFVCSIGVMRRMMQKAREFDDAAQTSTDYSLEVLNPPEDAKCVDEWRSFFSQFGHVTAVTVVLDNEDLTRALIARRTAVYYLKLRLPPGYLLGEMDGSGSSEETEVLAAASDAASPLQWWEKAMGYYNGPSLCKQIVKQTDIIREACDRKYGACEVFVTFENQASQIAALEALSVSRIAVWKNDGSALGERQKDLLFREKHVLRVIEPPEPSSVRWLDLDEGFLKCNRQMLHTSLITLAILILGCILIVRIRRTHGAAAAAFLITTLNTFVPYIIWYLTDYYESHRSEGFKQSSRFAKITLCLWVNTTIITSLVTPFTETLSGNEDGIIRSLYAIYIFEILKGPVTQLMDPFGMFYRHYLAPRCPDQWRMNLNFQGTYYEISERYTDMVNVLFITFYYAQIFPAGFFLASLAMTVHYFTDKFCLLRVWYQAPAIGTNISNEARNFIIVTLMVYAIMTAYNYSSFPADNVCRSTTNVSSDYIGNHTLVNGEGDSVNVSISNDDVNHFFCDQNFLSYSPITFPPIPANQPPGQEWMNDSQADIAYLFGWISVIVFILGCLNLFYRVVVKFLWSAFCKPHQTKQRFSKLKFSDVYEIHGYVPQIPLYGFPFPLLICDTSDIDAELIGWKDPRNSHKFHNVIFDVPSLTQNKMDKLFSVVKCWPMDKDV